jgi:type IV secretory pathway TrbL component
VPLVLMLVLLLLLVLVLVLLLLLLLLMCVQLLHGRPQLQAGHFPWHTN